MPSEESTVASSREFDLVSIVVTFDPAKLEGVSPLGTQEIEAIEESLGETLKVGQVISTDRGSGSAIAIQRRQVDLLILGNRIEARSLQPEFSSDVARLMVKLLDSVISRLGSIPWDQIGYNFVLTVPLEGVAVQELSRSLLKDDLETKLGHPVKGGAVWVWLEVEDTLLWLRLQPHRDSPTTKRITANANFLITSDSDLKFPSADDFGRSLLRYYELLDPILKKMDL